MNELDDSLLLAASCNKLFLTYTSVFLGIRFVIKFVLWLTHTVLLYLGDGNIRIWKDYTSKGEQKLVTAFSSIQGHKPGVRSLNAVVDWQQQSGYLVLRIFKMQPWHKRMYFSYYFFYFNVS